MKTRLIIYSTTLWLVSCLLATGASDPLDQWHPLETTGITPSCISYSQGKWLGLAHQLLVTSTNGREWAIAKEFSPDEEVVDLAIGNGLWVLTGRYQFTNLFVLTSSNGNTWITAAIPTRSSTYYWPEVRHHPDGWLITTATSDVLRSDDGQNWRWSSAEKIPGNCFYGDGRWIAEIDIGFPGNFQALVASTNLIDWHWWRPWPFVFGCHLQNMKFVQGLWVAVTGPYGTPITCQASVFTSTDGTNWIKRTAGTGVELINGRLVATGPMSESDPLISLQQNKAGELTVRRGEGIPVVVETSSDLHQWTTLTNLSFGNSVEAVTDPTKTDPQRFYRARTP